METHLSVSSKEQQSNLTATWLQTHRIAIVVVLVLLGGALAVRLLTFERFLPAQDYTDESGYYILVTQQLGFEDAGYLPPRWYVSWQPVHIYASSVVVSITNWITPHDWHLPSEHIYALRLMAVFLGVLTTAAVAWSGWQLVGLPGGILAGSVWAFSPLVVSLNSLGTPDPYAYLFTALAVATSLKAWRASSPTWLLGSLLAGILAIFSKFPTVIAVAPFSMVTLYMLIKQPRRMLPWVAFYGVIAIAAMVYLFGVLDPFDSTTSNREVNTFKAEGVALAFQPNRVNSNARIAVHPITLPLLWIGIIGGIIGYAYNRWRGGRTIPLFAVGMLAVFFLVAMMMASTFTLSRIEAAKARHVMPGAIGLIILWTMLSVQAVWALQQFAKADRWRQRIPFIVFGALLIAYAPHAISGNWRLISNFQKTYPTELVWTWTDATLPREGLVWIDEGSALAATWNRPWGGYDGSKPFEWWNEPAAELAQYTPEELVERGITHLLLTDKDRRDDDIDLPQMNALLDQAMLVKTISVPPIDFWFGDRMKGLHEIYIYRVVPPQMDVTIPYGEAIRLTGYDISTPTLQVGESLDLRFFWQAETTPARNYSMFVHLYPENDFELITQHDGPPLTNERPTSTWDDPDAIYISEQIMLDIPQGTVPGRYRLAVGLYDHQTGERLPTEGANNFYEIPIDLVEAD